MFFCVFFFYIYDLLCILFLVKNLVMGHYLGRLHFYVQIFRKCWFIQCNKINYIYIYTNDSICVSKVQWLRNMVWHRRFCWAFSVARSLKLSYFNKILEKNRTKFRNMNENIVWQTALVFGRLEWSSNIFRDLPSTKYTISNDIFTEFFKNCVYPKMVCEKLWWVKSCISGFGDKRIIHDRSFSNRQRFSASCKQIPVCLVILLLPLWRMSL